MSKFKYRHDEQFNFRHQRALEKDVTNAINREQTMIEKGLYKTGTGVKERTIRVVATGVSIIMPNGLTSRNNILYCTDTSIDKFSDANGRSLTCCPAARFLEILPDGSKKFEKLKGERQ